MLVFRQRVINLFQDCTKKIIPYALSLAASENKRTYAGIAKSLDVEYHSIYDPIRSIVIDQEAITDNFIEKVKKYQTRACPGWLIFDFTRLAKSKDAQTPKTTWDRDARINKVNNGFSIGFCMWTNGSISIPLSFCFWLNKKDAGESYIEKKLEAQSVIKSIKSKLVFLEVLVDGEFSSNKMMEFFAEEKIDFTARIARNRKVTTEDGVSQQLQFHQQLRLQRNEKSRTVKAFIGTTMYNFTAVRQKTRGGKKKIVFIISTINRPSKEHVKIYDLRWRIEKFFRTSKQSLGLEDCQSQKLNGIEAHIVAVMWAFIALEETKYIRKKKSV